MDFPLHSGSTPEDLMCELDTFYGLSRAPSFALHYIAGYGWQAHPQSFRDILKPCGLEKGSPE